MMNSQNFDIQKLHLTSMPVQMLFALVLAAVIVVAGYFIPGISFQEQLETLDTAQKNEEELKTKYEGLAGQVANLKNLEAELKLIENSIASLIKKLPTDAELPDLIQELYRAAASNGLTLNHVTPRPQQSEDNNIRRLPFSISVTGTYEQISDFMRDIGYMSRIVTLSSINIVPAPEDEKSKNNPKAKPNNKLVLTAIASTYKAVDTPPAASAASDAASAAQ